MALAGDPPFGEFTFLQVLSQTGIHEREETTRGPYYPLLHPAAEPPKLHGLSSVGQNLA